MIDIVVLILLYMVSFVLNYSLIFAHLQRSGPEIYNAHEAGRIVKDVKFAVVMSLVGFLGTPFIFFHTHTNTNHIFTGFLLIPTTDNTYWENVADAQYQRHQQYKHSHHANSEQRSPFSSTGRLSTYHRYGNIAPPPPKMKHERAENDTDGRCKSIWD